MSEDLNITPGSSYTVIGTDGVAHHDVVHSVRYTSAQPEIRQRPTGWRRLVRRLTPGRWRKPLPVVRPYEPAGMEVIGVSEVGRRARRVAEDMHIAVSRLMQR